MLLHERSLVGKCRLADRADTKGQIMKTSRITGLVAALASALVLVTTGCDRTVSHKETEEVQRDGTVEKNEKTVTESPDGTIKKEEKKSVEKP